MPPVNWNVFEVLPGGVESNFEMLCRALIRRHYGRYGSFAARAAQPGVEFHLKLHMPCALSNPGRWYGWQCRWYDLPGGRALGTTRRKKIEEAIATTETEIPDLTDWVLWTRRLLTKGDQTWFFGLKTHMRLHLWTAAEVEEHLSGEAEILRGTYFGELVLTPNTLADLHEKAVAPIRRRWQPEVHQTIAAERTLRLMLGESETWDVLRKLADRLEADAAAVDSDVSDLAGSLADATFEVVGLTRAVAAALAGAYTVLDRGDLDLLRQQRLFCEVTNPTRERIVGIEAMPGSLTALFDRSLKQAAERIAELAPRSRRYYEQDVRTALDEIGLALWQENARSLDLATLRRRLGDEGRPWNESIVRALEQDGVLLRVPADTPAASHVAVVYDALAGHLIADALLARHGRTGLEGWLKEPATVTALAGPLSDQHPLATDTFRTLVGLVPRRLHRQQLWPWLNERLRTTALRGAADLEGAYLDAETVHELATLAVQPPSGSRDLFDRLWQARGAPAHPLNAEFLDTVLRPMSVADRDLRWTEWIRRHQDGVIADLRRLENRWRQVPTRSHSDRLRAQWVVWTLTSTVRELRDRATHTLYWFGRGEPAALFDLTLDALAINDPYVSERLLAASYGVTMAHQLPDPGFVGALTHYLMRLRDALTGSTALNPTSHWLARLYVQGTVTLARTYHPDAVPNGLELDGRVPFAPGPMVDPIASDDPRAAEVEPTLRMDFENYTLGRLFRDRRNYDRHHPGHEAAVAHVLGTVWALGWRETGLGAVDKNLTSYAYRGDRPPTERYGKKYGWIGYYTYAGMLDDDLRLPTREERLSDLQIDPSFPEPPPPAPIDLPIWARPTPAGDRRWIRHGIITVPDELLYRPHISSHLGPWLAVHASLHTEGQAPGRRVFGRLTAMLVAKADADQLVDALNTRDHPGGWWFLNVPENYYTFAGEIPWNPEFARRDADGDSAELYRNTIRVGDHSPIEVETLAHRHAWESYHSVLNEAGGALVPSLPFSTAFDLRGIPQSFNQTLPNGAVATVSFRAPTGFGGHLLYLREDLVYQYAAGRQLIWFIWGERQLHPYPFFYPAPSWLVQAQNDSADVWRQLRKGDELSRSFASRSK